MGWENSTPHKEFPNALMLYELNIALQTPFARALKYLLGETNDREILTRVMKNLSW